MLPLVVVAAIMEKPMKRLILNMTGMAPTTEN